MPKRKKVLVSACLLGRRCRYDGRASIEPGLAQALSDSDVVPVCPEELGGLYAPREPAEIRSGAGAEVLEGRARVVDRKGRDVTDAFVAGAREALEEGVREGIEIAYLKSRSPSCGVGRISVRDGTRPGNGILAELLARSGIAVVPCEGGGGDWPDDGSVGT